MASTVISAFDEFLDKQVNLDPDVTDRARSSRDRLLEQLRLFPEQHEDFPHLYADVDIHYGSFARRTKIRELDDLDMIVGLAGRGTTYFGGGNTVQLLVPEGIRLRQLCHDTTNLLNSRRVINAFVRHLAEVPQYQKAEIKRNESAAVLNLTSYTWSFDIVPGFFTTPEADGRTYYVIPDGAGHWMKTDPRIDQAHVSTVNQACHGHLLNVIRIMKFWNNRATMPTMASYLLECIVVDYYERIRGDATQFVDIEVKAVLPHIATAVLAPMHDPKRIQGDINSLTWNERLEIADRATSDAAKAVAARAAETAGNHKESLALWAQVFGPTFPRFD